jgi:hypothetical protein
MANVVWPVNIAVATTPTYRKVGYANDYGILGAPSFIMKPVEDVVE